MAANVGSISVKVTPDTSGFSKKLKADLAKIKDTFTVNVDINMQTASATAALDRWRAQQSGKNITQDVKVNTKSLSADMKKADKYVSKVVSGFTKVAKVAGVAALAVTAFSSAMNIASAIGPVLASSVGVLGLVPGMAAGAVAALVTVKLGVDGIKKAFDKVKPQFASIKTAVSNTFEKGLTPALRKVATTVPTLRSGFQGIAKAMTNAAPAIANVITNANKSGELKAIFDAIRTAVGNLAKAFAPLLSALLGVIKIGAQVFAPLTSGAAGAAQRMADFVNSAQGAAKIKSWIQGGLDAFKQLWQILKNLGSIAATVFKAMQQGGATLGGAFGTATESVKNFVKSAQGLTIFRELGALIGTVARNVQQVLGTAFRELGPVIATLIPVIKNAANSIGSFLVSAIKKVGPILQSLAKWIAANQSWLGPLALSIVAAAKAFGILAGVASKINAVKNAILGMRQAAETIGAVAGKVTGAVTKLATGIGSLGAKAGSGMMTGLTAIGNGIKAVGSAALSGLKSIGLFTASLVKMGAQAALAAVKFVALKVAQVAGAVATGVVTAAQWLWNAALVVFDALTAPITLIILAIVAAAAALAAGIYFLVTNWTTVWNAIKNVAVTVGTAIASFFSNLWNGIKNVAINVWNAISGFFVGLWNGIVGIARTVWGALTGFFSSLWNGIKSVASSVWNGIKSFFVNLWNGIVNVGRNIWNGLKSFLSNAWNGIKSTAASIWNSIVNFFRTVWNSVSTAVSNGVKNVINFFKNLPGNILRALGNLGKTLWNAGRDLLVGLWNGIVSWAGNIWKKIKDFFGNLLPGWVKSMLGIASPSKVFAAIGVFLPQGMAKGMEKGMPDVKKAAQAMKDTAVKGASLDDVGTTFSGHLVKSVSADLNATASSPQFTALPDRIASALGGMEWRIDANGMAKLVNKANQRNRSR